MFTFSQGPVPSIRVPSILSSSSVTNHDPFSGDVMSIPREVSLSGGTNIPPPPVSGVHVLSSTVSTAHDASIRPNPQSAFHLSDIPGSEGLPFFSLELRRISLISNGFNAGSACNIRATTPETSGVAMEVPSFDS